MSSVLEIENLTVEYVSDERSVRGADRVSVSIAPGEVLGLAGESGCGKSTIANSVMRLLKDPARITEGSIRFNGQDVLTMGSEKLRKWRWKEVAMVFQSAMNSLNPLMTVGDQMADVFYTHEGLSGKAARKRCGELLEQVSLTKDRLNSYPHQLSGGQRQRVVIAMACALNPKLLILDEPTTALDVVVEQEILAQIRELQQTLGFAVLFITHDMSLMLEISDRIGVMYGGRLVELANSEAIRDGARHEYTRALLGAFPPMSGPRVPLQGLGEGVGFTDIGDLQEEAPGHFVAPSRQFERQEIRL